MERENLTSELCTHCLFFSPSFPSLLLGCGWLMPFMAEYCGRCQRRASCLSNEILSLLELVPEVADLYKPISFATYKS